MLFHTSFWPILHPEGRKRGLLSLFLLSKRRERLPRLELLDREKLCQFVLHASNRKNVTIHTDVFWKQESRRHENVIRVKALIFVWAFVQISS